MDYRHIDLERRMWINAPEDVDGDGKKEMVAAAFKSGLWLLRPGDDPKGEWSIESIDRRLLGPLYEGMKQQGYRSVVAVLPDHLTPVERGDHVGEPVPVLIVDPDRPADAVDHYDEQSVRAGALGTMAGDEFMRTLLWRQLG